MKRVALIDLQDSEPSGEVLYIHLFKISSGAYEWERSLGPFPLQPFAFSPSLLAGVKDFCLSLPPRWLNFRILNLPFSDPVRLQEVIPFELEGLIFSRGEAIVFDYILLREEDGGSKVLVAYAEQENLRGILNRLAPLSIDPRIITCLELRSILQEGEEELSWRLLDPVPQMLDTDSRLETGRQELVAPTINLRRGPLSPTRDAERARRYFRLLAVLSLSLGLILQLHLGSKILRHHKEITLVRKEMRSHYTALFPGDKNVADEVYFLRSHLKEFQTQGEALSEVDLLQLLLDLSTRQVSGIAFSEIDVQESLVSLKGQADSTASLEKMMNRLREPWRDISLSEMRPSAAGRVFFTLIARGK